MNALYRRLKKAFPFVNERAATPDDLFKFLAARDVPVIYGHPIRRGIYVRRNGLDYMFLNPSLHGWSLAYVLSHEIGHLLFHVPARTRNATFGFNHRQNEKQHNEAETVAALLLFPLGDIEDALIHGLHLADEQLAELIGRRLDYASQHKK